MVKASPNNLRDRQISKDDSSGGVLSRKESMHRKASLVRDDGHINYERFTNKIEKEPVIECTEYTDLDYD